jgi:hypothetical protein
MSDMIDTSNPPQYLTREEFLYEKHFVTVYIISYCFSFIELKYYRLNHSAVCAGELPRWLRRLLHYACFMSTGIY